MLTSVEKLPKIMENCTATFLLQSYQIFDFKSFNCNGTLFVLIYYTVKFNFFFLVIKVVVVVVDKFSLHTLKPELSF